MAKRPLIVVYKGKKLRIGSIGETIAQLPKNIRGKALEPVAQYYLKQFKKYPRYKYKSRAGAYPEVNGYFSDKQRRFVMAGIADGRITPGRSQRTNALREGWHIEGKNTPLKIVNDEDGAVFAFDPVYQARQLDAVGWKDLDEMTQENEQGAFEELIKWMNKNLVVELDRILLK